MGRKGAEKASGARAWARTRLGPRGPGRPRAERPGKNETGGSNHTRPAAEELGGLEAEGVNSTHLTSLLQPEAAFSTCVLALPRQPWPGQPVPILAEGVKISIKNTDPEARLSSNPGFTVYLPNDLGQGSSPLWASVST